MLFGRLNCITKAHRATALRLDIAVALEEKPERFPAFGSKSFWLVIKFIRGRMNIILFIRYAARKSLHT